MEHPAWVAVGRVVRSHGVRGAVKMLPYGDTLTARRPGDELFLQRPHGGELIRLTVVSLTPHGKYWLCQFQELTDRDEAQLLAGLEVFLPETLLAPLAEGEFYHYQLIGLSVETITGETIGVLEKILETPGNDVYVVERAGREVLIPAVEEFITEVDLDRKLMVVDLPEGLVNDL